MEIQNFYPKYPNIHKFADNLLNPYSAKFDDAIVTKKEFADLKLDKVEDIPPKGEHFQHQKIIARFMSSVTPYDQLLLFHEMGTGKTCTAIGVIEKIRYEKDRYIKGALVFAKGTGLLKNFIQELLFTCTDGRYIPENYDKLSDLERIHRTKKITSQFYSFFTFETFARDLQKITDAEIHNRYDNHIIVIDEVHNLRAKEDNGKHHDLDIYKSFFRFLHVVKNCKVLLMSGTVMKDGPQEIGHVMNLILPFDLQFPPDFMNKYFENNTFKQSMVQDFIDKTSGRISYLKAMSTDVVKIFMGRRIRNLQHFKVWPDQMSQFQTEAYDRAYTRDKQEKSIFSHSRQAALFVFPDGTYGMDGFSQDRYMVKRKPPLSIIKRKRSTYVLGTDLAHQIGSSLDNLKRFSNKYAETIKLLLESKTKAFVYCEFVNGSGLILFAKILDQFGYVQARGVETSKSLRYALITNQTTSTKKIQRLINRFNKPDNIDGEYISVVIGSKVISEGFTLKNIQQEFILTPHWNYSETAQAIARGWRLGSHNDLIQRGDKVDVKVYQQVSIPTNIPGVQTPPSIDLEMYETSEMKDMNMKQIEYLIKESSFDCPLNIARNKVLGYDNMRECDYTLCNYTCKGKIGTPEDTSTYNLYYSLSTHIENELKDYFRIHFSLTIKQVRDMFPSFNIFEIVQALKLLINDDVRFVDKYGFPNYVRIQKNIIFISPNPSKAEDDAFSEYYSKNLIISDDITYPQLVGDLYLKSLPKKIENIFEYPQYMRTMLTALPDNAQLILLQGCIQAHTKDLTKNKDTREAILMYFNAFYDHSDGQWVEWFEKDKFGINCLNETTDEWELCAKKGKTTKIEEKAKQKQQVLKRSPIGYYGLYNPKIDDFCIRDVRDVKDETDLRKLTVGRRCVDWELKTLIDIAVRRMKLPIPPIYLVGTSREELLQLAAKAKYVRADDLTQPDEYLKRFLFWSGQYRSNICVHMKQWFTDNHLIEDNIDCGHQKKKRARVM